MRKIYKSESLSIPSRSSRKVERKSCKSVLGWPTQAKQNPEDSWWTTRRKSSSPLSIAAAATISNRNSTTSTSSKRILLWCLATLGKSLSLRSSKAHNVKTSSFAKSDCHMIDSFHSHNHAIIIRLLKICKFIYCYNAWLREQLGHSRTSAWIHLIEGSNKSWM